MVLPAGPGAAHARAHLAAPLSWAAPSAFLTRRHTGDIEGALGRISGVRRTRQPPRACAVTCDLPRHPGPRLIVMVGDNDAGGVSTYAQAGQNYGYSLLWVLAAAVSRCC